MRICFITPEYVTERVFSGGLANYLSRVTSALAERRHDVHVIVSSSRDESISHCGVSVHRVRAKWGRAEQLRYVDRLVPREFYGAYQDIKGAWAIWNRWCKLKRECGFDLVQIPNCRSVGLFFHRERSVPLVGRLSNFRPVCDTYALPRITLGTRIRWRLERYSIAAIPFIFASSHLLANQVSREDRHPPVQVVEPPFFIEPRLLDTEPYNQHCRGKRYALFVGGLNRLKGVHLLADALPSVLHNAPDLHMIFVGPDGPSPDGASMRDYIRRRTLLCNQRVSVLDPLRHESLYPIIDGADFVVVPSLHDNLPNTCLEAMGLGQVVVATPGASLEQLITDGVSGILSRTADTTSLAAAMIRAARLSPLEKHEIAQRARERIGQLHPDKAIANLLAFYSTVIEAASGRQPDAREPQCQ